MLCFLGLDNKKKYDSTGFTARPLHISELFEMIAYPIHLDYNF